MQHHGMPIWIIASVVAAFAQNLRFMLQKRLKSNELSTAGATFARFLFSAPLVAVGLVAYVRLTGASVPDLSAKFWTYAMIGGLGQILATACIVALFAERNFAVGTTFAKSEVMMTVLMGMIVLGEAVSLRGFIAISFGFVAVMILAMPPEGVMGLRRMFNRAAGLGVLSGLLFSVASIGYRGASLTIDAADPFLRSGITLSAVTAGQTFAMAAWLFWTDRGEIMRVVRSWRLSMPMGVASMIGSFGWFTAFTLQNAAYVKAVGQIELIFSYLTSILVFRETPTRRETGAIALLCASILMFVLLV